MLVINGRFNARQVTGVERYGSEVSRSLGKFLRSDRLRIETGPGWRGWRGHLWEQWELPRRIGRSDFLWSPANSGPLIVERQAVTIHDLSVIDHPQWFSRPFAIWYRYFLPWVAARSTLVITDSLYSNIRIQEAFRISGEKVVVIPCGVDPERFYPRPAGEIEDVLRKYGLPERFVLFVGSIEPRKNLAGLLKSWEILSTQLQEIDLVVVGEGSPVFRQPQLDRSTRRVHWIGRLAEADLPAVYSAASLFVMPSFYEGFGLPVLEAMACSVPVAVSCRTALPEVVGDAGVLFDPQHPAEMAEAIMSVLCQPEFSRELSHRGWERAKRLSWDETARQLWQALAPHLES
jgi:glycosyltransferase involved in cell wall biosynthesis